MINTLTRSIYNHAEYNLGGISHIWLLNIDDFVGYRFKDDGLYDSCYVEAIDKSNIFFELGCVPETNFKESLTNGMYKQELNTFVRTLNNNLIAWLRYAMSGKFVVVVRTMDGKYFVFGSDGGARLSYSGQTGQAGDTNGITLKLEKTSIYPLFEVNETAIETAILSSQALECLVTENSNDNFINDIIQIA